MARWPTACEEVDVASICRHPEFANYVLGTKQATAVKMWPSRCDLRRLRRERLLTPNKAQANKSSKTLPSNMHNNM